ncbi:helix-turn-helix domain-containing protein [Desulfobacula toluolica]|uniref:Putative transcriptional regulator, Xre family n=1 Tax=Desulfobacula toluolica (strain DSM 7467 / Tol2) TaxID=651182 RepID=K0NJD1_DESTT|nr:helix-turn-helix transcriptional regulator [Desulfobacula toluolica]CCK81561.1 putative transcriptional regulator, Xre family [Desulfobacula toluolica Tol2]
MTRPTFKNFKEKALKNPEVKKEYEALIPIYELRKKLIQMRINKGLTQAEVAKRMGTKKSNISRLECGENVSYPTLASISKYAGALGYKVKVEFEPI